MLIMLKNTGFEPKFVDVTYIMNASTMMLHMFHLTVAVQKNI